MGLSEASKPSGHAPLNNDRLEFLRWLSKQEKPLSKSEMETMNAPNYLDKRIEDLRVDGLISRGAGMQNGELVGTYTISDAGLFALEESSHAKNRERVENLRYWITTAIAVAAFIKSFFF